MLTHSHVHASYAQCVEEDSATNSEAVEGRFTLLVSRNVVASELIHQARKGLESRLHLVHAFVPLTLLLGVGLLSSTFPSGATSRNIPVELSESVEQIGCLRTHFSRHLLEHLRAYAKISTVHFLIQSLY
jgi:hypothetical protein